jgi:hypothetical protein
MVAFPKPSPLTGAQRIEHWSALADLVDDLTTFLGDIQQVLEDLQFSVPGRTYESASAVAMRISLKAIAREAATAGGLASEAAAFARKGR